MPRQAGNSAKAERDQLRDRMRALGCSLPQIAVEMGRRFRLRPRVAWRHALGWPQWKLAQQYNALHRGAKLSDHRVSEYESWPHGGSPPSLRYLAKLAATYGHGCTPSQLVDADDLEHLLPADRCLLTTSSAGHAPAAPIMAAPSRLPRRAAAAGSPLPSQPGGALGLPAEGGVWAQGLGSQLPDTLATLLMTCLESLAPSGPGSLITLRERDRAYHQLVQFLRSWAHAMDRRYVLRLLGWAVSAASVFPALDGDEQQRLAAAIGTPSRVDSQTIEHIEAVLWHCRQQDYALGPQAALDTVLAQRNLARILVPECPESLRSVRVTATVGRSRSRLPLVARRWGS